MFTGTITRLSVHIRWAAPGLDVELTDQAFKDKEGAMPTKMFISYRRGDSAGHAGRVHDRLEREFGRDLLFMDVDAIPLGVNFFKVLREEVAKCDVLLAVIGPNWLNVRDEGGSRRLDSANDFVRVEIATALQRDIRVIPILLDGARIPKADQLPDDLKELTQRNGLDIHHASFHSDMARLIRRLKHQAVQAHTQSAPGKTEWFKDHEHGPELVVVPAGEFLMGSTDDGNEQPVHKVAISSPFAVGRFPVTFAEWDACVADGGCYGYWPNDLGWGRDRRPVTEVSWDEAKRYINWLNAKTGKTYRLLSEAEREYVTRAGTTTPFWWGSSITPNQANYNGNYTFRAGIPAGAANGPGLSRGGAWRRNGKFRQQTVPVDTFEPNPWGLFNVHGNVWEWCEDVWHNNYNCAPTDGSAWLQGGDDSRRVVRGGSWLNEPRSLRASHRHRVSTDFRLGGFRLARTLNP
jgi:formylglycine-generating enzyme required for sulfatase activity